MFKIRVTIFNIISGKLLAKKEKMIPDDDATIKKTNPILFLLPR